MSGDGGQASAEVELLQERVLSACIFMIESGLITGTWGMACARTEEQTVVVTPSGMDYRSLKPRDLPVVDLQGNLVLGKLRPTTETPMLTRLMYLRPDIGAIAHTHSTGAAGFAAAGLRIPVVLAEVAEAIGGDVPCAEYGRFGTHELADKVFAVVGNRQGALLRNHGVLTFGATVEEAARAALVVEEGARVALIQHQLGVEEEMDETEVLALRQIHLTKYGQR